jgi:photosystem II stability/assembly factor-like uncharacterized protein
MEAERKPTASRVLPTLLALLLSGACGLPATARCGEGAGKWVAASRPGRFDLLGVDFIDASNGWAVGDMDPRGVGGAVLHTTDGGRHWVPIAGRTEVFTSVRFVSPAIGWIAGYAGRIARTDDGGRTWRDQRAGRGRDIFNSIWAVDDRHAWAVGANGLMTRTIDGGATWAALPVETHADLWSVRFVSQQRGWAAGASGVVLSTSDGGATWTKRPTGVTHTLYGLAAAGSSAVVAVGDGGTILRSDDGDNWSVVQPPTSDVLYGVAAAGAGSYRAVGANGAVLGSEDAGRSWKQFEPLAPVKLAAVALADPRTGIAVGRQGFVQVLQ